MTAYKKIREDFPHIKILGNDTVNSLLIEKGFKPLDIIFHDDMQFSIGDSKFTILQNYHGEGEEYTETHGFLIENETEVLLYATDLSTTIDYQMYLDKHNLKIDVLLLEGNYDENVIYFYEESKAHNGFDIFSNGSYRHLAISEFNEVCKKYTKQDSKIEMLHQSDTYGTFEGLIKKSKGKILESEVRAWISQHTK